VCCGLERFVIYIYRERERGGVGDWEERERRTMFAL